MAMTFFSVPWKVLKTILSPSWLVELFVFTESSIPSGELMTTSCFPASENFGRGRRLIRPWRTSPEWYQTFSSGSTFRSTSQSQPAPPASRPASSSDHATDLEPAHARECLSM